MIENKLNIDTNSIDTIHNKIKINALQLIDTIKNKSKIEITYNY